MNMKTFCDYSANVISSKKYSKKVQGFIFSAFRLFFLLCIGYLILYPLLYMVITSISSGDAYNNSIRVWIPSELNIKENFSRAIEVLEYPKAFLSTFKNQIISALIEVASCAFVAYGFARFNFKGKKICTLFLLVSILVPDMIVIIPRVLSYSNVDFLGILGLFNKILGIDLRPRIIDTSFTFWIPSLLGVGLKSGILIYIYIQFFHGLPHELEEAAWIDGAGPLRTFFSIALPSSGVVILTVTIFAVIWHWNDSLLSSMYLLDDYPLAVKLSLFESTMAQKFFLTLSRDTPDGAVVLMAGCLLFILPMLVMYMIIQRWFIESIDRVGITG